MIYHLQIQCPLPVTPQALWQYYERLFVFERLSPPWEPVKVHHQSWLQAFKHWLSQPETTSPCPLPLSYPLTEGSIRLFDVPLMNLGFIQFPWVTWEALHESVQRGVKFQDFQLRGPFQMWEHRREMQACLPSGELCPLGMNHPDATTGMETHFLRFTLPYGELGSTLGRHFVYQKIYRMFRYRFRQLWDDLIRRKTLHALLPSSKTCIWLDSSIPHALRHPLAWYLNTMGYEVLLGDWLPEGFTGFSEAQKETLQLKAIITGEHPSKAFHYHLEDSTLGHIQLVEYPDSLYALKEEPLEPLHLLDTLPESLEVALAPHLTNAESSSRYALLCYGALVANRGEPTLLQKSKTCLSTLKSHEAREHWGFRWSTLDDIADALLPILHRVITGESSPEATRHGFEQSSFLTAMAEEGTGVEHPVQASPLAVSFVAHPQAVSLQEVLKHTQTLESILHNIPFPHQSMKQAAGLKVFELHDLELPEYTRQSTLAGHALPVSRFEHFQDAWQFYYGL
ncbi:MAG: hypothetical protein ACKO37_07545 [Vampirovibrionales bacterium]